MSSAEFDAFQSPLRGEVFGTARTIPLKSARWDRFSRLYAARCSGRTTATGPRVPRCLSFSRLYAARCSGPRPAAAPARTAACVSVAFTRRGVRDTWLRTCAMRRSNRFSRLYAARCSGQHLILAPCFQIFPGLFWQTVQKVLRAAPFAVQSTPAALPITCFLS